MKKVMVAMMATGLGVLAASSNVMADADIAVQTNGTATQATTNVDLCVVVPEILIFGVGAVGTTIAKLKWTAQTATTTVGNDQTYTGAVGAFTAPAPFTTLPTASIVSGGGATGSSAATNVATLPVFLFSNEGSDVTITTTTKGDATTPDALAGAGTDTIAISEFSSGETGSIIHPDLTSSSTADTAHTSGIVNLAGSWTYTYAPTSIPKAGTYEARVTYVAAQP